MTATTRNKDGEWVPAIPEPFETFFAGFARHLCPSCGEKFWTYDGYRGHYALCHILKLK